MKKLVVVTKRYAQPEFLFLITGLLVILWRLLFVHEPLDIPIHDTYIILDSRHVTFLVTIVFLMVSLPYTFFRKINKPLSKLGGWIHYLLTMLPWVTSMAILPITQRYEPDHSFSVMQHAENYNFIIVFSFIAGIFGQLVFLINILVTLLKKSKNNE